MNSYVIISKYLVCTVLHITRILSKSLFYSSLMYYKFCKKVELKLVYFSSNLFKIKLKVKTWR